MIIAMAINSVLSCSMHENPLKPEKKVTETYSNVSMKIVLPDNLKNREEEFAKNISEALAQVILFAQKNNFWEKTNIAFFDSAMIFDDKKTFDLELLKLAGADTTMQLPETYCGTIEKRTLLLVVPEYYSKIYHEGVEPNSFTKLIAHEMAHRLHIDILDGNEEAMGPIWFYEGFAIFVADQFKASTIKLSKAEMVEVMKNPERGSYLKYNYIFRYFVNIFPLNELISKSKDEDFNSWLISKIE